MIAALLLAACALQSGPGGEAAAPAGEWDSAEREWTIRRWALVPGSHAGELADALDSDDWRWRAAAAEALARGAPASTAPGVGDWSLPALRAVLTDPHPNVRAGALRALGRAAPAGRPPELRRLGTAPGTLEALAADVLPGVRLELARCLGRWAPPEAAELLFPLAFDGDGRVAREAREQLLALPAEDPAAARRQVELLLALFETGQDEALTEAAGQLERLPPAPAVIDALRLHLAAEEGGASLRDERARRAWLAVFEALALGLYGRGEPARVLDGWLAAREWRPLRKELLRHSARSADGELGSLLLAAVAVVESVRDGRPVEAPEGFPAVPTGFRRDLAELLEGGDPYLSEPVIYDLFECALDCLGPMEALHRSLAVPLTVDSRVLLLEEAGRRGERWDLEVGRTLLNPSRPPRRTARERYAAVEAIGLGFVHGGDSAAGSLLAETLGDAHGSVSLAAFHMLCNAPDPRPWLPRLYEYWSACLPSQRVELLAQLPRDVRLEPFRDALLELGEEPDRDRRQVLELLEPFAGDEGVRARLEAWLAQDQDLLAEARGNGRRHVELRVMALVRALGEVAGEEALPALQGALARSVGVSTDVGKTAAAVLGRWPAGRAVLAGFLGPEVDRRTRIEAAIALAAEGGEPAVAVLVEDYRGAAWDLRGRMLAALARSPSPGALAFLARAPR